ncbi:hypothetical protein ASPZODRAFT_145250 [Penicilliopsis zonata CBS 506.65]|uniref:RNA polymerase II holoenzyme cyclin-like subunit n=1 Tax=Penicilliopsis zonata CBS 506.65 TaxID=1073090 RepID=A0A1L9SAK9_9EURO|nr:hypothetical protein ASPZODRAFT_145250 [Penicilliopsis zonata CBS 506.65]OJJ44139.1 hypothetical protein ASPZODRAFT_145250 [Penicilliopsis zonata CBS 506.65]
MAPENREDAARLGAENTDFVAESSLPHPSFIQVAKPYVFEQTIQDCLASIGIDPLREEALRLQGVTWIDNVRRALRLPVRTYNTAVVYYHKFRLVHADNEYNYVDAAAAALLTACKIEDTLKKSREIVAAAYNAKLPPGERMAPDDPVFEGHARGIIGLERLMLEASGFDFRTRHPQNVLIKLAKQYGIDKRAEVSMVAYRVSLDLYRTFAPLKQTTATMAFSCLEIAGRLLSNRIDAVESGDDYRDWRTSREEVMGKSFKQWSPIQFYSGQGRLLAHCTALETLLDLLELYTHHRTSTLLGPLFPAEIFLTVRIPLNQEAEAQNLPRYSVQRWNPAIEETKANGRKNDRPQETKADTLVNPLTPASANGEKPKPGERGRDGTVRFMLDPEQAESEKRKAAEYFRVEFEEYEVPE